MNLSTLAYFTFLATKNDILFELYTRQNPFDAYYLKVGDFEVLRRSPFSGSRTTKIIIHGWTDSSRERWILEMKTKYLETGDYNVVCLNWFPGSLKEYSIAAELTRQVGNYLGSFLHFLASARNFSLDNVHVLGHSLGAHIAGSAGEKLQGKIGRITGMDPARPNFESPFLKSPMDRLDPSDAKFVDVIHTCAGTVGFIRPIGHVDFYPNGGTFKQPGCAILTTQYCSHGRSHEFMTWSIVNSTGFPSLPCDDWLRFKTKQCKSNLTVFMGEKVDTGSRGVFYLATNSNPPYGKGVIYDS